MPKPFLIFGHRGSPKRHAENTLASFDEALRGGADGFETDLRLLSDGATVLFHDDELSETEIETLSSDDIAARKTVAEPLRHLERYASRTTMILEVKRGEWEETLIAEIGRWPNIIVASFDHGVIQELSRRHVSFALGLTVYGSIVGLPRYARELGASWCFPNYRYVGERLVRELHDAGIQIAPWTPNRPHEWERLRSIGCDGIITDLPAEAVEWRNSR